MRKFLSSLILAATLLLAPAFGWAAGTAVFSAAETQDKNIVILQWVCTADGSGNVSSPTITEPLEHQSYHYYSKYTGIIGQARIKPGTGADAPTAAYDVYLNPTADATIDFLGGIGVDNSATVTTFDVPATTVSGAGVALINDVIQPKASGCGVENKFTLIVYLWLDGEVR